MCCGCCRCGVNSSLGSSRLFRAPLMFLSISLCAPVHLAAHEHIWHCLSHHASGQEHSQPWLSDLVPSQFPAKDAISPGGEGWRKREKRFDFMLVPAVEGDP